MTHGLEPIAQLANTLLGWVFTVVSLTPSSAASASDVIRRAAFTVTAATVLVVSWAAPTVLAAQGQVGSAHGPRGPEPAPCRPVIPAEVPSWRTDGVGHPAAR